MSTPTWGQPTDPALKPPQKKPWVVRHKVMTGLLGVFGLLVVAGAVGGGSDKKDSPGSPTGTSTSAPASTAASSPAAPKSSPPIGASPSSSSAPAAAAFPGQKKRDMVAAPGAAVRLSGWTATSGKLAKVQDQFFGPQLCTSVTLENRDDKAQTYGIFAWKIQTPSGDVKDTAISDSNNKYGNGDLVPGGKKTGRVCFDNPKESGTYVVLWQPDLFSSDARGAWINKV